MAREIKFRAWHEKRKTMFSAEVMAADQMTLLPTGQFINISPYGPEHSEIYSQMLPLQFTGMLDKNGKEIYEGDIVRGDNGVVCKVEFVRGAFVFISGEGFYEHMENTGTDECDEVIGNIYENPELAP